MARRDSLTMELPGLKRRVGRPATGKAKSNAQRQAAYRTRQRIAAEVAISVTSNGNSASAAAGGFLSDGASTTVTNSHN